MKTKLIQIFKKSSYWLSVATLGIILGLSIQFAKAWTEPTGTPPDGNVGAPINVGDNIQYKAGTLGIGKILHGYSNAVFDGNVGIGTIDPSEKLDVQGGRLRVGNTQIWDNEINRYDNSPLYIGYRNTSKTILQPNGGDVGIGTRTPSQKLDVIGNARVSGSVNADRFCDENGNNCISNLRARAVYANETGCGGGIGFSPTCRTLDCSSLTDTTSRSTYYTCSGSCTSRYSETCTNSVVGYIVK